MSSFYSIPGPSGTIQIGTVTKGAPQSEPVVTNSGTPEAAVLNFSIPQGESGIVSAAEDGTAAAPGIAFAAETGLGVYRPGAGQLALSTNGTQRLLIDASGNVNIDSNTLYVDATNNRVGIRSSSPGKTLDVNGESRFTIAATINNGSAWYTAGAPGGYLYLGNSIGTPASIESYSPSSRGSAYQLELRFKTVGSNGAPITAMTIDSSGRLLVGTSSARANLFNGIVTAINQVEVTASNTVEYLGVRNSNNTSGSDIVLAKSRGTTAGSNTIVQSGDGLGAVAFMGSDGTEFVLGGRIACEVDGTPGANDMPGRLVFSTTADGASSPTERMRITSDAYVRLASGTGGIQFNGDTAAANALDDYEEGTWTPTLGGSATYNFQSATYTKVGRQVTVNCYLDVNAIGTGSTSVISGLPFTVGTFAPASGAVSRLSVSAVNVTSIQVQLSGTSVTTVGMTAAGNMATQNVFGNSTAIYFTATYFV